MEAILQNSKHRQQEKKKSALQIFTNTSQEVGPKESLEETKKSNLDFGVIRGLPWASCLCMLLLSRKSFVMPHKHVTLLDIFEIWVIGIKLRFSRL